MISFLLSGKVLLSVLFLGLIIETSINLISNTSSMLSPFGKGEENYHNEAATYASRSLTLASLTFAVISFILTQNTDELEAAEGTLLLFFIGLVFFISSFKLEVFAPTRRIYFDIQQRLFNYGLLSLVLGLYLLSVQALPTFSTIISVLVIIIFLVHVLEFVTEFKYYSSL